MAQRNILCTDRVLDLEIELGQIHHPKLNVLLGNTIDLTNPSIHTMLSASGSTTNVDPWRLSDNHDAGVFYGNECDNLQHHHHSVPNLDAESATPSVYNPYMIPSSTSSIFPMLLNQGSSDYMPSSSNHGVIGVGVDDNGRNNFLDGIQGPWKRYNADVVPGSHHYGNGSTSSSSSSLGVPMNSRPQQWDEPFEPGSVVLDTVTFTPSRYRGSGVLSITEGSQRSVRSKANTIGLHLDSALAYHHNHPLQGSCMVRSFQLASKASVEQFGNNYGDANSSNWNYALPLPHLHGRSVSGGLLQIGSMTGLEYQQDTVSSSNLAIILHPSSMQYHHSHYPPLHMQGMQGVSYNYYPQLPAPSYRNPTNCISQQCTIISSRDGPGYASWYQRSFTSGGDGIYRPNQRASQSASDDLNRRLMLLSSEDVAVLASPPGSHGAGNLIDQHRDMRLDIDDMSYENPNSVGMYHVMATWVDWHEWRMELLALEEQIGDVNTGLSEETISICLRTRMHASSTPSPPSQSSEMVQVDMNCTMCQVDYRENEKIGILECGHEYHADCIKQWLLLKNICPICKATALSGS